MPNLEVDQVCTQFDPLQATTANERELCETTWLILAVYLNQRVADVEGQHI